MARQAPSWSKFEILANLLADRSFSDLFWAWVRIDSIQPSLLLAWVCQSHGLSAQGSNSACNAVISLLRLGLNQWGTPSIPKDESILCPFPALGGSMLGLTLKLCLPGVGWDSSDWVAPRQDDQQWQRAAWCLELMGAKHLEADELSKSSAMNHRISGETVFGYTLVGLMYILP